MNKNFIRILFILIVIILLGQYYFTVKYSEPYPAIVYPAFRKVSDNTNFNSYLLVKVEVEFSDNDKITITGEELLPGLDPYKVVKILSKLVNNKHSLYLENPEFKEIKSVFRHNLVKNYSREPVSIKIVMTKTFEYFRYKPVVKKSKEIDSVLIRM